MVNSAGKMSMNKNGDPGVGYINTLDPDLRTYNGIIAPTAISLFRYDMYSADASAILTSMDANGGTLTLSQGGHTAIYTLSAANATYTSYANLAQFITRNATQLQTAGTSFTAGSPITVTFTPN